ncbi:MAG: VOC family protein [Flavobacteriales bacterium]
MLKPQHNNLPRYSKAFLSFSVMDIEKASRFYTKTLGLRTEQNHENVLILLLAGDTEVVVYEKKTHEPAAFTLLNFPVEDVELALYKLKAKGLEFLIDEHDLKTDKLGIFRNPNGSDMAWFKDPSGNILALIEQKLM